VVLVMSPIYLPEITAELERLHARPHRLLSVEDPDLLDAA
jgi:hypothetical protein